MYSNENFEKLSAVNRDYRKLIPSTIGISANKL